MTLKPDTYQIEIRKKDYEKWIARGVIILIIVFAIGFVIVSNLRPNSPQVKVLDVDAERYGISEYSDSCRATITAIIQNYGDVDAYVTVKLTSEWAGESHSDVKTVFVKAHSTANAVGSVQATLQWFNYKAEIIEVRAP